MEELSSQIDPKVPYPEYKQKISDSLSELSRIIEEVQGVLKARESIQSFQLEQDIPRTRNPNERGDMFYWVFEGVKNLIKDKGMRSGCRQKTFLLFRLWEMSTNEEAVKKHKRRDNRSQCEKF